MSEHGGAAPSGPSGPGVVQATFCATLVDEWIRGGVAHAVIAPGSRSTPLALALAGRSELAVHVFHDERSASFAALGIGRASGVPAVLLCTSGTAAANFHPAVIEAHQDDVPLVVCTADRPPELRDVGAPQTIDQTSLYGNSVRWFHDPGVADASMRSAWRSIASRSVLDARGATAARPGPVHLNLPFRDPLVAPAEALPPSRSDGGPWHRAAAGLPALDERQFAGLVTVLDQQRGVIVAGAGAPAAVVALGERIGWPVLADPRSCARGPAREVAAPAGSTGPVVAAFDAVLRHPRFAVDHTPTIVLRFGPLPASKVLGQWLARSGARHVHVAATVGWSDPEHLVDHRVVADPAALCDRLSEQLTGGRGTPWLARWRAAETKAQAALDTVLAAHDEPTEPAVARAVTRSLPPGAALMVSSSMPVRDVEWFGLGRTGPTYANRGANGIDGVTSTAVGIALADPSRPTALLIGDVAFLHDTNALVALRVRQLDLTIVVVDNDGGGIFSFLPQRSTLGTERFEQLFGTPHGTDPGALAAAHGLDVERVETIEELKRALTGPARGSVRVLVVRTDRDANVAVHDELNAAVVRALDVTGR